VINIKYKLTHYLEVAGVVRPEDTVVQAGTDHSLVADHTGMVVAEDS
jgi:hypothetical protein